MTFFRAGIGEVVAMPASEIFSTVYIQDSYPPITGPAVDYQRADEPPPATAEIAGGRIKPCLVVEIALFARMTICLRILKPYVLVTLDGRDNKTDAACHFAVTGPIHRTPLDAPIEVTMLVQELHRD